MKKYIVILLLTSLSCASSNHKHKINERELYSNAFCALMNAKHDFTSPNNIREDTVYILDQYYLDTTSLFYNQLNLGFQLGVKDTSNIQKLEDRLYAWNQFRNINKLLGVKKEHNQKSRCLKSMKLEFISAGEPISVRKRNRTFVYSPLMKLKGNNYVIYEHKFLKYSEFYYYYCFKRVGNSFEFYKRDYSEGMHTFLEDDFIKNGNFDQTLEEYLAK